MLHYFNFCGVGMGPRVSHMPSHCFVSELHLLSVCYSKWDYLISFPDSLFLWYKNNIDFISWFCILKFYLLISSHSFRVKFLRIFYNYADKINWRDVKLSFYTYIHIYLYIHAHIYWLCRFGIHWLIVCGSKALDFFLVFVFQTTQYRNYLHEVCIVLGTINYLGLVENIEKEVHKLHANNTWFSTRAFSILRFCYRGIFWNQFSVDIEGWLYVISFIQGPIFPSGCRCSKICLE